MIRTNIETRIDNRTKAETLQVVIVTDRTSFPIPPVTLVVPVVVGIVTFFLALL
jgi:hypothetical protein